MNKQILYISYDGLTDPLGQSQVLPYLFGLADNGYNITIISAEKPEKFTLKKDEIARLVVEHNIDWHPISYTKHPPILSTMLGRGKLSSKDTSAELVGEF